VLVARPVAPAPPANRTESAEAPPAPSTVPPLPQPETTPLAAPATAPLPRGEHAPAGASAAAPTASSAAAGPRVPDGVVSGGPSAPAPVVAAVPREGSARRVIPRALEQQRPAYPASARRARIQGTTLLAVLVADDGRVAEIVVKESAGIPISTRPPRTPCAAGASRLRAAGDDPIAMWVELPVEFRLR
jgi:protein TonB